MVLREDQENAINGKQKDSVREEIVAVSGTTKNKRAKSTPTPAPPSEKDGRNTSRRESLRGRSPSGKSVQRLHQR